MCPVTLAALFGLAASACAIEQTAAVLAPDDPHIETHWKPDPLFGGVKTFSPVGRKAWTKPQKTPAAQQTMPPMDHHDMTHHETPHEEMQPHEHMPMDHHHMMNMDHDMGGMK